MRSSYQGIHSDSPSFPPWGSLPPKPSAEPLASRVGMLERQNAGLAQGWPARGQGLRSRSRPHISEHPHPLACFQGPRLHPLHWGQPPPALSQRWPKNSGWLSLALRPQQRGTQKATSSEPSRPCPAPGLHG